MMRRAYVALGVACLAAAGIGVIVQTRHERSTGVARAQTKPEVKATTDAQRLGLQIQQLRNDIQHLKSNQRVLDEALIERDGPGESLKPISNEQNGEEASEGDPQTVREQLLERHFQYADDYRAHVLTQPRDPQWAIEKEREFQAFFEGGGMDGYLLESVTCRATTCAVELVSQGAPPPMENIEALRQYLVKDPFRPSSYWAPSEQGLLIIVSRQGHSLPNPQTL